MPKPPLAAQPLDSRRLVLAATGASGAVYTAAMLRALDTDTRVARVHFVVSTSALRVFAEELGISGRTRLATKLLGKPSTKVAEHSIEDIGAAIASGSFPIDGMIVRPAPWARWPASPTAWPATSWAAAADVCLKERRKLILCVRETPFNRIHLRNMLLAEEAGATIYPAMPVLFPQATIHRRDGPTIRRPRPRAHRPPATRRIRVEGRFDRLLSGLCAAQKLHSIFQHRLWALRWSQVPPQPGTSLSSNPSTSVCIFSATETGMSLSSAPQTIGNGGFSAPRRTSSTSNPVIMTARAGPTTGALRSSLPRRIMHHKAGQLLWVHGVNMACNPVQPGPHPSA